MFSLHLKCVNAFVKRKLFLASKKRKYNTILFRKISKFVMYKDIPPLPKFSGSTPECEIEFFLEPPPLLKFYGCAPASNSHYPLHLLFYCESAPHFVSYLNSCGPVGSRDVLINWHQ